MKSFLPSLLCSWQPGSIQSTHSPSHQPRWWLMAKSGICVELWMDWENQRGRLGCLLSLCVWEVYSVLQWEPGKPNKLSLPTFRVYCILCWHIHLTSISLDKHDIVMTLMHIYNVNLCCTCQLKDMDGELTPIFMIKCISVAYILT